MKEEYKELMKSLSWYQPEEEQEQAIQELIKYKDKFINSLISDLTKDQWHNAVS